MFNFGRSCLGGNGDAEVRVSARCGNSIIGVTSIGVFVQPFTLSI